MLTVKLVDGTLSILVEGVYTVYRGSNAFEVYDLIEHNELVNRLTQEGNLFELRRHINNMLL
jgi:hypothetical protein